MMYKEPIITVAMLSFRRVPSLLKCLKSLESQNISMNLVLRVQGEEDLTPQDKSQILEAVRFFKNHKVMFTPGNEGVGPPRHELLKMAREFNTRYVAIGDDDMWYPSNMYEVLMGLIDMDEKLGVVGCWCKPAYPAWHIEDKTLVGRKITKFPVEYVDALGSATMLMKKEVLDTCAWEKRMVVGWADLEFCMQIRNQGWKLAILSNNEVVAQNNYVGDEVYDATRRNKNIHDASKKVFVEKWGMDIRYA